MNKYYNEMLQGLVKDARELLDKADGVQNRFNMSIDLIKAVVEVVKLEQQPIVPVQVPIMTETSEVVKVKEVIEEPEEEDDEPRFSDTKPLSKKHYIKFMETKAHFTPSDKCYEEYCILWERRGTEDALLEWKPDNLGLDPIPEDAYISLAIKENPRYKALFEEGGAYANHVNKVNLFEDEVEEIELSSAPKTEEELQERLAEAKQYVAQEEPEEVEVEIDEEEVVEEQVETVIEVEEIPTDITSEVAGGEVVDELEALKVKIANMPSEEATEFIANLPEETKKAVFEIDSEEPIAEFVMTPDGTVTRVDEPKEIFVEIEGEQYDATEAYKFIKGLNNELSHDELLERASDWIEFAIEEETYNKLATVEDESADLILCKTYLAYYIQALTEETVLYYLNYFANNIEDDENGEEVYVNEEILLDFLNKDNIEAFVEYIQVNQQ